MKCMCAQTRPRFILTSEGVLGGMEFEPMLTPREKSPLPENVPRGGSNPRHRGQRAHALPTELFRPPNCIQRRKSRLFSLLTAPRTVSNTDAPCGPGTTVCKSRAAHRALIVCNMCATWYEGTAQLLSLTEFKSLLFELYFYWLNH